jgi:hypothetical protein
MKPLKLFSPFTIELIDVVCFHKRAMLLRTELFAAMRASGGRLLSSLQCSARPEPAFV